MTCVPAADAPEGNAFARTLLNILRIRLVDMSVSSSVAQDQPDDHEPTPERLIDQLRATADYVEATLAAGMCMCETCVVERETAVSALVEGEEQ